jgi:hypothetical protein
MLWGETRPRRGTAMLAAERGRESHTYTLQINATESDESAMAEMAREREQRSMSAYLHVLTGGCEICQHQIGLYCEKQRRPVNRGDPRCDFFLRRVSRLSNENLTKAQIQEKVNDILGITEMRTIRRLTGVA